MERAVAEMQKHPGVALEIPDLPKQNKSRGTPTSSAIAAGYGALSADVQTSLSSGEHQLFSKSRRGRMPTAEAMEGLDLHAISDGEDQQASSLQRPVALTQDVKTPKGRRRHLLHESMDNSLFSTPEKRRPKSARKHHNHSHHQPRLHNNDQPFLPAGGHHDPVGSDSDTTRRNPSNAKPIPKSHLLSPRGRVGHGGVPVAGQSKPSYVGSYQERKERESMILNLYDAEGHQAPSPTLEKPRNLGKLALLHKKQAAKGKDRFATDSEIHAVRPVARQPLAANPRPVQVSYRKAGAFPSI